MEAVPIVKSFLFFQSIAEEEEEEKKTTSCVKSKMEGAVRGLVGSPLFNTSALEMEGVLRSKVYSFQLHESAVTAYLAQSPSLGRERAE